MLHILWTILKLLGILLLVLAGLLLFLIFSVLFLPVCYRVQGKKYGEKIQAKASVSWLFSLVRIRVLLDQKKPVYECFLFGIPLLRVRRWLKKQARRKTAPAASQNTKASQKQADPKKPHSTEDRGQAREKSPRERPSQDYEMTSEETLAKNQGMPSQERPSQDHEASPEKALAKDREKPPQERPSQDHETTSEEVPAKDQGMPSQEPPSQTHETVPEKALPKNQRMEKDPETLSQEREALPEGKPGGDLPWRWFSAAARVLVRIWHTVRRILAGLFGIPQKIAEKIRKIHFTIRGICDKIKRWRAFLQNEDTKKAIQLVTGRAGRVIRHLCPRKIRGEITFGFSDPSLTGQALAAAGVLYPLYKHTFQITPVFDHAILEGQVRLKGRIFGGYLLLQALRILCSKEVRVTWKRVRQKEA